MVTFSELARQAAKKFIWAASIASLVAALASCGETNVCGKSDVLNAVSTLWQRQQFPQVYDASAKIFSVQENSATDISPDKDARVRTCSVVITFDLIQFLKVAQRASDDEIEKQKASARARGVKTTNDNMVNYTVQTMNDGQHYVTVLP